MKNIRNTILRLIKSLLTARRGISFAHDVAVLKSDYSLELDDEKFQKDIIKQLIILEEQKSLIESDTDFLIEKIDNSIKNLKSILSLMV